MKKQVTVLFSIVLASSAMSSAVPEVTDVKFDADTRRVNVTYTLTGAPGIVTAMFLTNGVPIDSVTALGGDVNRFVTKLDSACSFTWIPECSWSGHRIKDGSLSVRLTAWSTNCPPDYMAINLSVANAVFFYERAEDLPGGITNDMYKTEWLLMRKIPAAGVVWHMGSPTYESNRNADNEVQHPVMLTYDYYMGVYMVTQRQYYLFSGGLNPSMSFMGGDMRCPVNRVKFSGMRGSTYSWPADGHKVTADSAIGKLRAHSGIDSFDLPTEAEWEYACRAGSFTAHYDGTDTTISLGDLGWYNSNSDSSMHIVGLKQPNAWNLYDLYGNAGEFCLDRKAPYTNTDKISIDPVGAATGSTRVYRGGTYEHSHDRARSASRDGLGEENDYGSQYGAMRLKCAAVLSL